MKRIVVMISGSGTNLQALIDAISVGTIADAAIVGVVSNRKDAFGLERARNARIQTLYLSLASFKNQGRSREEYDEELARRIINDFHPDLIVTAGWMHILGPAFLDTFDSVPIINLHPALPGMFAGVNAIERALEGFNRGEIKHTGCMIHRVIAEIDAGETIATKMVPIDPSDTIDTLEARMHQAEHELIVDAVNIVLKQLG